MKRRAFLATGAVGLASIAGCLGNNAPAPRRSNVFEKMAVTGSDGQTLEVDTVDNVWVESRWEPGAGDLESLSPVGVASAKGKGGSGRGATGRGSGGFSSAPKTSKGRAKYHGGGYVGSWRDDHDDEIERYDPRIQTIGIAFLGSNAVYSDDPEPPGPVPWDATFGNPDDALSYELTRDGWYRVGAKLVGNGHDFGWECVDVRCDEDTSLDEYEIEERWKVSPRL